MSLFNYGGYILHSGRETNFKIDCDHLMNEDMYSIAKIISLMIGRFSKVVGIGDREESGGRRLARFLKPYERFEGGLLIVDDVLTTGRSMEEFKRNEEIKDARRRFAKYEEIENDGKLAIQGAVIFARGPCPHWITPLFTCRF
jgi:hypothetical protein